MIKVTEAEFNSRQIMRRASSVEATDLPNFEERAWYAHGDRLGIVLWDNIESDWAFVALQDRGDGFKACSADVGFATIEAAEEALSKTLGAP
jgi:hypothetical protein